MTKILTIVLMCSLSAVTFPVSPDKFNICDDRSDEDQELMSTLDGTNPIGLKLKNSPKNQQRHLEKERTRLINLKRDVKDFELGNFSNRDLETAYLIDLSKK